MATHAVGENGGTFFEPDRRPATQIQMFERALRQGWEIPEAILKIAPAYLASVIAGRNMTTGASERISHRTRIRAVLALAKLKEQLLKMAPPIQEPKEEIRFTDEQRVQHLAAIYTELFGVRATVDGEELGHQHLQIVAAEFREPQVRADDAHTTANGVSQP